MYRKKILINIKNYLNLIKKIDLLKDCLKFEESAEKGNAKAKYQEFNSRLEKILENEKAREERKMMGIIGGALMTKGYKPFTKFSEKLYHPFKKIIDSEEMSSGEKVGRVISKGIYKTGSKLKDAGTYSLGAAADTSRFIIKHSIKQPTMLLYRLGTLIKETSKYAVMNLGEGSDESAQEQVKKNIKYEGEKLLRAVVATAAIAAVDTAIITTGGVNSIAATAGTKALLSVHEIVEAEKALGIAVEAIHYAHTALESTEKATKSLENAQIAAYRNNLEMESVNDEKETREIEAKKRDEISQVKPKRVINWEESRSDLSQLPSYPGISEKESERVSKIAKEMKGYISDDKVSETSVRGLDKKSSSVER